MFNLFKTKRGDELLRIEKNHENFDLTYVFRELRNQGVTDDDIRNWWNMPDEQHLQLMQECDETRTAAFMALVEKGLSKKEAVTKLRKGYPIYEVYKAGVIHDFNDDNLPYELLPRVNKYISSLSPKDIIRLHKDSSKTTSMNRYIRDLINTGII